MSRSRDARRPAPFSDLPLPRKRVGVGERVRALIALMAIAVVALPACKSHQAEAPRSFDHALTLGGRSVSPAHLGHGGEVYTHYCRACHGAAGDAQGPAAPGLRPPPRDLRLGIYKFGAVAAGQLPTDADFVRIITGGLHGTGMLAWDIPPAELDDLIQYVKAFAQRWQTEKPGDPIVPTADPWPAANEPGAIARGRSVYHGLAQCAVACHPAYAPRAEIYAVTKELTHMDLRQFRDDLYAPVAKDSDYGFKILPPDFTFTPPRSGETAADIYRSIAAGIGGTAMPTWKSVLPEGDLWAMAHYVRSLVALRGTRAADELRERLANQPAWSPPPPPGAADAGAREGGGTGPAAPASVSP
jgi:mono/diheme cytochrome c family protein